MDLINFRNKFPEFCDQEAFPSSTIQFWSSIAEKLIDQCRWDDMYDVAVQLYTAHHLVISATNQKTADGGGIPGSSMGGITSSKSVGSVSVSYDTQSAMEKDAGYWNTTIYGRQFYHLMMLFGAGAVQL